MRRRWRRMPPEVRRQVLGLAAQGYTYKEIKNEIDISDGGITMVLRPMGGVLRADALKKRANSLTIDERQEIWLLMRAGRSQAEIARKLGRHRSTICRELAANGGRAGYRPHDAHQRAFERARRPKVSKLEANPELWAEVERKLKCLWSPHQIDHWLKLAYSDDAAMTVSHETIYRSVYVQGRGQLRRELAACLRTGRATRKRRNRMERRGRIPDMVNISQRPPEIADRAVPGHWEGDLIMGAGNRSAIGTLVERSTRFVMLLHLPDGHSAEAVRDAMAAKIQQLPAALRRSITWDQGKEMAEHVRFSVDTGVEVYFCDPHSPWQRGSNENTNGLLRQYFPKGTDLSVHTKADLDAAADSLNGRPRMTLGWMTPSEKFAEVVALTA